MKGYPDIYTNRSVGSSRGKGVPLGSKVRPCTRFGLAPGSALRQLRPCTRFGLAPGSVLHQVRPCTRFGLDTVHGYAHAHFSAYKYIYIYICMHISLPIYLVLFIYIYVYDPSERPQTVGALISAAPMTPAGNSQTAHTDTHRQPPTGSEALGLATSTFS